MKVLEQNFEPAILQLPQIRKDLEGTSEDLRYQAWMNLYRSKQKEYVQEFARILREKDSILQVQLARFLGQVAEWKAIECLVQLLLSDNSVVFEAAQKAFDKNTLENKTKVLLVLLQSPFLEKRLFAIERLAKTRIYEALSPFIQLIQKAEGIEKLSLVKAFRYLAEPKVYPLLKTLFKETDLKVRIEVLLVLIKLYKEGHWRSQKLILQTLQDKEAELRQIALWGLRQNLKRRHQKYFEFYFFKDKEIRVREEALKGLCLYDHEQTIRLLLQAIAREENPRFALKIEASLLTLNPKKLKKTFWKLIQQETFFENTRVLFYLAQFEKKSQKYFKFLSQKLKESTQVQQQVRLLEALGELRIGAALSIFEFYLKGSPFQAYYALLGIIRLMKAEIPVPLEVYFEEGLFSPSSQEVVLKEHLKVKQTPLSEKKLLDLLSYSSAHSQVSISYLAALNLMKISSEAGLEQMFKDCALQKDFPLAAQFQKMMIGFFKEKPDSVLRLLDKKKEKEELSLLMKLLSELEHSAGFFESIFPILLNRFRENNAFYLQEIFFYLLQSLLFKQKLNFYKVMQLLQPQEQGQFLDFLALSQSDFLSWLKSEDFSKIFFSSKSEIQEKMLILCSEKKHVSFYNFAISLMTKDSVASPKIAKQILSNCIQEQNI